MKVLGVGEDKFICEVSYDEIFELIGGNQFDEDFEVNAGDEINLTRILRAANWIRTLDEDHIDDVIRQLNTVLHGMNKVKETAQALTLFAKLSDKELENE